MSGIGFGTKRPPDQPPEGPPAKRRNMAQAGPFASLPSPDAGSGDRDYVYALLGTGQMVVDFFAADSNIEQFLAWIDCSGIHQSDTRVVEDFFREFRACLYPVAMARSIFAA